MLKHYFTFNRKFAAAPQRHAFHLVDPRVMPLITALSCLTTTVGGVMFFHGYKGGMGVQYFGLFCIVTCMFL